MLVHPWDAAQSDDPRNRTQLGDTTGGGERGGDGRGADGATAWAVLAETGWNPFTGERIR